LTIDNVSIDNNKSGVYEESDNNSDREVTIEMWDNATFKMLESQTATIAATGTYGAKAIAVFSKTPSVSGKCIYVIKSSIAAPLVIDNATLCPTFRAQDIKDVKVVDVLGDERTSYSDNASDTATIYVDELYYYDANGNKIGDNNTATIDGTAGTIKLAGDSTGLSFLFKITSTNSQSVSPSSYSLDNITATYTSTYSGSDNLTWEIKKDGVTY